VIRQLVVVFLGLVGLVVGVFGLLFTPLYAGPVPLPLGIVVSALTLPWLVRTVGDLDPRPWAASSPLVGWLVAVFGLGLFGPGGDRMLPPTWQSILLVFAGIGASLWALRSVIMEEAVRAELERQRDQAEQGQRGTR
jgi:hypothetical protein